MEKEEKRKKGSRDREKLWSCFPIPASWKHTMKFAFSQEVTEQAPWIDPLMEIWLFA